MKFSEIPFHNDVKQSIRHLVDSDSIPHALLLEGEPGAGKFLLARALAQYIHCTGRMPGEDSCGKCPACLQHEKFNHIDTFFTFPVLKKSGKPTLSVDYMADFRDFLDEYPFMDFAEWLQKLGNPNGQPAIYVEEIASILERANLKARQSKYKIIVVWLPERLREEAANKLLKLLEEPPSDTIFILCSDNPAEILPTIYSRTRRLKIKRSSDSEISQILSEKYSIDSDAAIQISRRADGNMNHALKLIGANKENALFLDLFIRLMRGAWLRKVGDLREWSNEVAALGRERAVNFYEYCARMVRENFIMNFGDSRLNDLSSEEQNFSVKFSPFVNSANVMDIYKTLSDAVNDTLLNGNGKIIAFDLAVKMILLIKRTTG